MIVNARRENAAPAFRPGALPAGARTFDSLARWTAAASIAFLVIFNIALISLDVASIPVRGILVAALLIIFSIFWPDVARRAIGQHAMIIFLAAVLAAIGVLVSLVNGASAEVVTRTLLEVHVQAIITLLFATIAANIAGARTSVIAIVLAVAITVVIAALQFFGLEAAWDLRATFGALQEHALNEDSSFINRRPMGLSYSPIHLATQACLAFAAYAGLCYSERPARMGRSLIDARVFLAVLALVAAAIICETRSPILGAVIFAAIYAARQRNFLLTILVLLIGGVLYLASPLILSAIEGTEYRVLRVNDNSASGRIPLMTFGVLLFLDNPLGYGFDFVSHEHWTQFWHQLYHLPSSDVVQEFELHNYALSMLTTYGFGLLLVVPIVFSLIRRGRIYLVFFIPYIAHILFHNSGPFWNDTLFWFVIGALSAIVPQTARNGGRERLLSDHVPRNVNRFPKRELSP